MIVQLKQISLILINLSMLAGSAVAQQTRWSQQDALHQEASDAAQCYSFYAMEQRCAANSAQDNIVKNLQKAIDSSSKIYYLFGKSSGMSESALLALLKLSLQAASDNINNSCINISVLVTKSGSFCKFLLEHPEGRLETLLQGPPSE